MTKQTRLDWFSVIYATLAVLGWLIVLTHFKLHALATILGVITVPPTIYNIVRVAKNKGPICKP